MFLVMAITIDNNLPRTRGLLVCAYERHWTKWQAFLYFAAIFVANTLFSRFGGGDAFRGTHLGISNYLVLLLPVVLWLSSLVHIPLSLTFLVQSMFARENLIPRMLPGAAVNYFLSLAFSLVFWSLMEMESVKNTFELADDFWFMVLRIFTGVLWYNLFSAFAPNFAAFLPEKSSGQSVTIFLFSGLTILFSSIQHITSHSEKHLNTDTGQDIRFQALFNVMYTVVMLMLANLNGAIPIITPWITAGLSTGTKMVLDNRGGMVKFRIFLEKITRDLCKIFVGTVVAMVFVDTIRT
jgi:hypothetical protein